MQLLFSVSFLASEHLVLEHTPTGLNHPASLQAPSSEFGSRDFGSEAIDPCHMASVMGRLRGALFPFLSSGTRYPREEREATVDFPVLGYFQKFTRSVLGPC